jgi:hypothetical protein
MQLAGFNGWASFWRTAYFLPGFLEDSATVRHELRHLQQIEQDGRLLFLVKYVFFTLAYGYRRNLYEVEARNYSMGGGK